MYFLMILLYSYPITGACFPDNSFVSLLHIVRGPSQDVPFFYTQSHLSELKIVSQIFQLIYLSFSYLNSVRHFLGIELCCEQIYSKSTFSFFALDFLAFFNNAHFHIYFY